MTKTRCTYLAVALCAAMAAGCSEGVSRQTLTAPSPVTESTGNVTSVIADRTTASRADVGQWAARHGWATAADGLVVEGTDTITAVSDACPTKTITIRGVPVALTAATTFGAPLTCASLAVGTTVKVTALLTFTATGFTVTATNVAPADGSTPTTGTEVEGVVASFTGSCPALTITLEGTGGVIVTNASTVFDPSTACAQVAPGVKIEAIGTRDATNQLVATKLELDDDDEESIPGGSNGGKKARGEGVVGAITGSCPTLTLVITGTKVSTTATTEYVNGSCASLRPGTKVTIDGELRPGGTAVAEKIEIRSIPGRKVSGDGKVDAVTGSCPSLELTVRGVKVSTSSETTFTGGACSDIKPGSQIDVTGDYDGTEVVATSLYIKKK